MKIIIMGYEYFGRLLETNLNVFDEKNNYKYLSEKRNIYNLMKKMYDIFTADIIYVIGGTIKKSIAIDIGLLLKKKVVMHWVGTDVLSARDSIEFGLQKNIYIKECKHLCEIEWIKEELKEIGINAKICDLILLKNEDFKENMEIGKEFSVLTYMAKGREKFYGIDLLYDVAKRYPNVKFIVVGSDGKGLNCLSNVNFVGWTKNMKKEYENSFLFLRLVKHDGLAFSVIEALALSRYVGYTYPLPIDGVFHIKNKNDLFECIDLAMDNYNRRLINIKGHLQVICRYDFNTVLNNLVVKITE